MLFLFGCFNVFDLKREGECAVGEELVRRELRVSQDRGEIFNFGCEKKTK